MLKLSVYPSSSSSSIVNVASNSFTSTIVPSSFVAAPAPGPDPTNSNCQSVSSTSSFDWLCNESNSNSNSNANSNSISFSSHVYPPSSFLQSHNFDTRTNSTASLLNKLIQQRRS
jgi:hypothetical protein